MSLNSKCPNKQLLSAFVDQELDPDWTEQIRKHLAQCGECSEHVTHYNKLSEAFTADSSAFLTDEAIRFSKVKSWNRIQKRINTIEHKPFWNRSFKLPVPLAAAAVLALIGFSFFAGLNTGQAPGLARESTLKPAAVEFNNMEELVGFLNKVNPSTIELTGNLPEDHTFQFMGEPMIVKGVDYNRSR